MSFASFPAWIFARIVEYLPCLLSYSRIEYQPNMDLPRMGNQLADPVSTMPAAGGDRTAVDLDESTLNMTGGPRPRRHDDDEEGSDAAEDDDVESTTSAHLAEGAKGEGNMEEEKELPQHACA